MFDAKKYIISKLIRLIIFLLYVATFNNITNAIEVQPSTIKCDTKKLENIILDNTINSIIHKTIPIKDNILDDTLDTSYIEQDKSINHKNYILHAIDFRQRQKILNIKTDKDSSYIDTNTAEYKFWLLYSYDYNKKNKVQTRSYKQERDHNICIGLESDNNYLIVGCAYIQAEVNISTILNFNQKSMYKDVDMKKYYGLFYALYGFNDVNNNCAFTYGNTNHVAKSHENFSSREYSMMVSSSYTLSWKRLAFDFGITGRLINIYTPTYKNGKVMVHSSKVNYLSGGAIVAIHFNNELSPNMTIVADLNISYLRNFIENNKRIMSVDYGGCNFIIRQNFNMKQNWYFEARLQAIIYKLSFGVAGNYNYMSKNRALQGYSFFITINF